MVWPSEVTQKRKRKKKKERPSLFLVPTSSGLSMCSLSVCLELLLGWQLRFLVTISKRVCVWPRWFNKEIRKKLSLYLSLYMYSSTKRFILVWRNKNNDSHSICVGILPLKLFYKTKTLDWFYLQDVCLCVMEWEERREKSPRFRTHTQQLHCSLPSDFVKPSQLLCVYVRGNFKTHRSEVCARLGGWWGVNKQDGQTTHTQTKHHFENKKQKQKQKNTTPHTYI